MNKAVFLDRDGTINYDSHYVFEPEKVVLLKDAASAISRLKDNGFLVIIYTNQSCVGRGYASIDQVHETNKKLFQLLSQASATARIDLTLIAPDHPEQASTRRKPAPGMILEACEQLDLDLSLCWAIGDKDSDTIAGESAGIPSAQCLKLIRNGEGSFDPHTKFKEYRYLADAVDHILDNEKP